MNVERTAAQTVAKMINEKVNLKFIPEAVEEIVFEAIAARLLTFVSKRFFMDENTLDTVINTVDLAINTVDSATLRRELAAQINTMFDAPILTENEEQRLLEAFLDILIPSSSETQQ